MSTLQDALNDFALEKNNFNREFEESSVSPSASFVVSAHDLIKRVENGTYKQTPDDIAYATNRLTFYRGKIMDAEGY